MKPESEKQSKPLKKLNDNISEDYVKLESEDNINVTNSALEPELDNNINPLKQVIDNPTEGVRADCSHDTNDSASGDPPAKRMKTDGVCVCCIGLLQEENWPQCCNMVQEVLNKKS